MPHDYVALGAYGYDFVVEHARLIVDTRNSTATVRHGREKIYQA